MGLLDNVKTGVVSKPPKLLVWGTAGVGKSTFASGAPKALFIEAEDRTAHLDVSRIAVTKWEDVLTLMAEVGRDESKTYETIVFDTIDSFELLVFKHIAAEAGCDSHEDIGGGFAKFRTPLKKEWKRFLNIVDALTRKGIQCILLAHAQSKTYQPPTGEKYDRFILKMDAAAGDLIVENVDLVGEAKFKTFVTAGKGLGDKSKAVTNGDRCLSFKFTPAAPTKQGVPCADECELNWDSFKEGLV